MTTSAYINLISGNALTLSDEVAGRIDESSLATNEYFAFLFCAEYMSYLRNYEQYKGRSNYNDDYEIYDLELNKSGFNDGFYISKLYDKIADETQMGRAIIVSVTDLTKCVILT